MGHYNRIEDQGYKTSRGPRKLRGPVLRVKPITFLELCAITENIQAFVSSFMNREKIRGQEEIQAYLAIINAMNVNLRPLLRKILLLHSFFLKFCTTNESQCLPSAVNLFADRLSRFKTFNDRKYNTELLHHLLEAPPIRIDRISNRI